MVFRAIHSWLGIGPSLLFAGSQAEWLYNRYFPFAPGWNLNGACPSCSRIVILTHPTPNRPVLPSDHHHEPLRGKLLALVAFGLNIWWRVFLIPAGRPIPEIPTPAKTRWRSWQSQPLATLRLQWCREPGSPEHFRTMLWYLGIWGASTTRTHQIVHPSIFAVSASLNRKRSVRGKISDGSVKDATNSIT